MANLVALVNLDASFERAEDMMIALTGLFHISRIRPVRVLDLDPLLP